MKRNEFLQTVIIIPAVMSIILCIVFFFVVKANVNNLLPVSQNVTFAHYDSDSQSDDYPDVKDKNSNTDKSLLKSNDYLGTLTASGKSFAVRYDADYSALASDISLCSCGSVFGETGCVYLNVLNANGAEIKGAKQITYSGIFQEHTFTLEKTYTAKSEQEIITSAPKYKNSAVIYYRNAESGGIKNDFTVLVYKEAK